MSDIWQKLTAHFPPEAIEWRIIKLSDDQSQAQVQAQLYYQAVVDRLNQIGLDKWSNRYIAISDDAIAAEIGIMNITKSWLCSLNNPLLDTKTIAQDAFVQAAAAFGIKAQMEKKEYWVDYDLETKTIIFEPELEKEILEPSKPVQAVFTKKPETKEVIARLVERLGMEGLGLDAAKLLTEHGGYGESPESAKILYGKLRALLLAKKQKEN